MKVEGEVEGVMAGGVFVIAPFWRSATFGTKFGGLPVSPPNKSAKARLADSLGTGLKLRTSKEQKRCLQKIPSIVRQKKTNRQKQILEVSPNSITDLG
jgi:hypothetical protein